MLLAFSSYLAWGGPFNPATPAHMSFADWMERRPELRSVLSRMLRR
jgi:nicotinic acid mononucleotide adenylyltransferase